MFGREDEIALLTQAASILKQGAGQSIRLSGPAGIGKSTLIRHMLAGQQQDEVTIVRAACQTSESEFAYYAFRPILRTLLGLASDAQITDDSLWTNITEAVVKPDPTWRLRLPLLGDILGVALPDSEQTRSLSAELRRQILTDFIIDIITMLSLNNPNSASEKYAPPRPAMAAPMMTAL